MTALHALIGKEMPNANLLSVQYRTGWLSNSDPEAYSRQIEERIGSHYRACSRVPGAEYERIVLLGYSAGAVMVRRAFLIGLGGKDVVDEATRQPTVRQRQPWTEKAARIVLIAGMNRGWSFDRDPLPSGLAWSDVLVARALIPLARFAGVGAFVFNIESGAPFVANLRIDWLRAATAHTGSFPLVAQILGQRDEFVTREDETDISVSRNFVFLPGGEVNHAAIMAVDRPGITRDRILEALKWTDEELIAAHKHNDRRDLSKEQVERIVFVRHGIRDDNLWAPQLRRFLCQEAATAQLPPCTREAGKGHNGRFIDVNIGSYGYFGMLPFLFRGYRDDKVRKFVDDYTEAVAASGNPDVTVDFVGHSNGTYLLAAALEQYRSVRVSKVVFANSVVPQAYGWNGRDRWQVTGPIRNYMAAGDWVVAVFPRLFELHTSLGNLGSAGFKGFLEPPAVDGNVLLHGSHGAGIAAANWKPIADFLFADGRAPNAQEAREPAWLVDLLWKLPYIGWVLAVALAVVLFRVVFWCARRLATRFPAWSRLPFCTAVASLAVIVLLIQI
jgi:hypothetical protein